MRNTLNRKTGGAERWREGRDGGEVSDIFKFVYTCVYVETETAYITKKGFADSGLPTLASLEGSHPIYQGHAPEPLPEEDLIYK